MPIASESQRLALELGRLRKHYPGDRARELQLRRQIAESKIEQYVADVLSGSPPLSDEAVERIHELLVGAGRQAVG